MIAASRHPHQPRRQDLARGRRRARHGQDLRRAAPRPSTSTPRRRVHDDRRRRRRQRGRRHLDRRLDRRRLPRRGPGRRQRRGRATSSGPRGGARRPTSRRRADQGGRPAHGARRQARAGCGVRANADTPEDAARARRFGAEGIGLLPHRAHVPRRAQELRRAADPGRGRGRPEGGARRRCCRCSARTSSGSSRRWTGCRSPSGCIDPPLHEFLPDLTELAVRVALAEARGRGRRDRPAAARRPSTGCTSRTRCSACAACGSAWCCPGLFALQVRAIAEAACFRQRMGGDPRAGDHDPARRLRPGARAGHRTRPAGVLEEVGRRERLHAGRSRSAR